MDLAPFTSAITDLAYPFLVAISVAMARAMGMILLTPAFARLGLTGLIRGSVAAAISLPLVPEVFGSLATADLPSAFELAALVIKEMLIGAVIGLAFGIPFWAAEVAGDLVDLQRGSTMAQLLDPLGTTESSITATLLTVTLVALFFSSGGFLLLLDGFYQSYTLWPAAQMTPAFDPRSFTLVLSILDSIMRIGVVVIAPVVIAILIADVMLSFLSRMAPQLHIFDLSLSIKNLLFSFLMVIYLVFLIPLFGDILGDLATTFDALRALTDETSSQ